MDADSQPVIDEEAIAEEEFVADVEDVVGGNPLVYGGNETTAQNTLGQSDEEEKEKLAGAIGTGDLASAGGPFNNENALRSESVNNNENPFGVDSGSEKAFGGPGTAPLDNATDTIAPNVVPEASGNSFGVTEPGMETSGVASATMGGQSMTAGVSEPTIGQLTNNAAAEAPQMTEAPMTQAPVAATTPVVANETKKSKKGLIIGIIVAVVLLLAALIGGIIFYNLHESKERALADAMSGIWGAEARQFDGKVAVTFKGKLKTDFVEGMVLSFKSDNKATNFSGSGDLTVNFKDTDPLNISVSSAYISGDSIYVKLDKLEDTVKNLDLGTIIGADGDDTEQYVKLIEDVLVAVAKEIDGTWYKINAETFGDSKKAKESYECLTKALDELSGSEVRDKVASIYKAHPFIVFKDKDSEKADGLTYYYVDVNKDESKAFSKDVEELNVVKDLKACSDSRSSTDGGDSGAAKEEIKAETDIKLGISGWSHELRAIKGTSTSDEVEMEIDIKIGYDNKDVSAPASDATNIADAVEDLYSAAEGAYKKSYLKMAKEYCKNNYGSSERAYEYCYDMMEKELNRSLSNLLGGLGGSIIRTSMLSED